MPTPKQMEKLAAEAVRRRRSSAAAPDAPLPAEYWESVLKDPRADATGAQMRQRRLSEIQHHVLRISCRRCERTVEIQTADSDEVARVYRYEVARGFRDDVAHLSDLISPGGEAF